jgi:hypothetical protein
MSSLSQLQYTSATPPLALLPTVRLPPMLLVLAYCPRGEAVIVYTYFITAAQPDCEVFAILNV